jgi:predicted RNase H-like HicB family nuclease
LKERGTATNPLNQQEWPWILKLKKRGELKMIREFNVVIERDEDGYFVASVPALRGCHTQAKSLDVLMKRIREAIELCLEVEEPTTNEFVGVQRVAV